MNTLPASEIFPVIENALYLCIGKISEANLDGDFICFDAEEFIYVPFCDDFGPMNLSDIFRFADLISKLQIQNVRTKLVYTPITAPRELTNAVFLVGCYLLLVWEYRPEVVWLKFSDLIDRMEMYRDATYSEGRFRLSLLNCWGGLQRAKDIGWIESIDLEGFFYKQCYIFNSSPYGLIFVFLSRFGFFRI